MRKYKVREGINLVVNCLKNILVLNNIFIECVKKFG